MPEINKVRILLADDHALFRSGMEYVLAGLDGDVEVIEGSSYADAVKIAAENKDLDIALAIDRFQGVSNLSVKRIQSRWAGLRTFAPDGNFVVGADPRLVGYFWFAGQGGYGFQSAPAMAALICRLVLNQAVPNHQVAILRQLAPDRLMG